VSERTPDPSGSAAERLWWFRDAREPLPPARSLRLPWLRRKHTLDAIACLSLSTLCFSQARSEMLFRPGWDFYAATPLRAPALVAFTLNIAALAVFGFLGAQWIRRVRRPVWRRLAAGAAAAGCVGRPNSTSSTATPPSKFHNRHRSVRSSFGWLPPDGARSAVAEDASRRDASGYVNVTAAAARASAGSCGTCSSPTRR
jgi:hypothetical protein